MQDQAILLIAFSELFKEVFASWIYDADRIISDYVFPKQLTDSITTRSSPAFIGCHLKRINMSMNNLKVILKILCEAYCDTGKEFDTHLLLFELIHTKELKEIVKIVTKVNTVAKSYRRIFERSKRIGINIDDYVSQVNQDNIHLLEGIDVCDLRDILK